MGHSFHLGLSQILALFFANSKLSVAYGTVQYSEYMVLMLLPPCRENMLDKALLR
jgi:hypothetical protein